MELGLSLGDSSSSKSFDFLASKKPPLIDHNHISSGNTPPKSSDLGFCMALGIHSSSPKTARKSAEDDNNTEDYSSEETIREQNKELHLLPCAPLHRLPPSRQQFFPWSSDNGSSEGGSSGNVPAARGFDVNRLVAAEEVSSPNSAASSFGMDFGSYRSGGGGNKRGLEMAVVAGANDGIEGEGGSNNSRGGGASDDDENGLTRKKLRLSKEQSAFLEESFKEHNTLNPKQKLALAKQLNLRPRQVEVWFQNRRARTKLKQTEVDCEYLKRCCETLTEENRKLHKELQELRVLKSSNPYYMQLPATTLTMCPSCERVATTTTTTSPSSTAAVAKPTDQATNSSKATATANPFPFPVSRPKFFPFCQTTPATSYPHKSAAS